MQLMPKSGREVTKQIYRNLFTQPFAADKIAQLPANPFQEIVDIIKTFSCASIGHDDICSLFHCIEESAKLSYIAL